MATKPENVNPFAKYVEQSGGTPQENPFARFVTPALDVEKLKAETKKYEEAVPFTQRITDPLKQGIANLSGLLPGLEVSSIQKEINAIREGKRGPRDPLTGEQLPFQPEEQENAIKMLQEQQKEAQAKVMSSQAEAGKFQTRPAVAALSNVDTAKEAFKAFQVDPLGVMSSVSLQSIPTIVPSLILGAVTRNPTVGALAMGSTSFASELSSGVSEYFQEQGINIKDPIEVNKALNDPAMFTKAYEYALTRGSIIGVADTAAAGLASKLLVPKNVIKNQFAKEAVNIGVAQPVAQILSGAGGEAAAQIATEGEVTKPGKVLLEAAGEGPSSVLETAAFGGKEALNRLKTTPTEPVPEPSAVPAATVAPAAVPSAIITEEDIDTDEGLTPVSPTPTPPPAAPAAVAPSAPEPAAVAPIPPAVPTAEIAQRIDELDAELKAIDAAYDTATPDQFTELNARQGQIKSEIARLFQAGTTGAPVAPVEAAAPVAPKAEELVTPTIDSTKVEEEKPKTELQQVMEKEEKLESPTISKKSVIPHATVYVAPYKDGFVSGFQYYGGGKSQVNISTPLYLENIYPTRQEAVDVAAKEIRERAEEDKNKVALKWLDTVSTPVATKTQAEINRDRQAEKKAAAKKEPERKLTIEEKSALFEKQRINQQREYAEKSKNIVRTPLKEVTDTDIDVAIKALGLAGADVEMADAALPYLKDFERAGLIKIKPGKRKSFTKTDAGYALDRSFFTMSYEEKRQAIKDFLEGKPVKPLPEPEPDKTQAEINKERQAEKASEVAPKIEDIVSPEVAASMKDLEFQNRLIKANKEKTITENQFSKLFNLYQDGKTPQADEQLTKMLAKNEQKAKAKEEPEEQHIEGKTSEPVTNSTIEDAIDKAESNVDSKKIKTAIKNQFDQAIKRAKIQTEKEWESAKGLLPAEKFVTISVPGDGQFKVKNNVERLKELQTKMVNATTLKGPTVQGGPTSGSVEAFKGMVDDKDMENAIEYAKLKGLDPKTVKLSPAQRATVDNYLKNPAEFERQQEESTQRAEARQTALRADQEKRTKERLEADEKREEEARFKAVLDTTIRSTQQQLKGDIAKRKITSADAARMLEVILGLPTGTVKPYVTKELQKIAAPKAGVVTDDEGEKLDFPLAVDMANKGYKILGFDNPRTYENKGGVKYRTFEKEGVRIAVEPNQILFTNPQYPNRPPQLGYGNADQITWHFIGVDKDQRKQGKATQAIKDFMEVADKNGYTVYGEPAQLEKEGMTAKELSNFYSKFGFAPSEVSEKVIIRRPQIADDSRTIDVEAIEITPSQMKLLTNQVGKLSDADIASLEEHYGIPNYSDAFMQRIREDIITYTNKGADAIDKAIRSIIAKLQAGILAVAIVFNPAYMSEPSAVVFPSKPGVEQVKADIPVSANDMSDGAKKAYATLYPALQAGLESKDKLFTIVDKPTSKMYVFNPDGSLLVKDNVLLGKALGDTYIGQTEFKENRMTPAGLIKVKSEKGSATYDGKTIYTFGNVKEGWRAAFIHTVYLKEADAEARKKALETGKDTRLSHGCINAKPELMAKIAENNRMDESHVFVVPDNQEMVDDYIANTVPNEDLTRETVAPVTRTTQVPEKPSAPKVVAREEKAVEQKTQAEVNRDRQLKKLAQRDKPLDKPYYNDFTSNIDYNELYKRAEVSREDRIKEYAQTRAAGRRMLKKVAKYGSDIPMQRELNELLNKEEMLKVAVGFNKPIRNSADDFMARATQEMANENLAPEVEAVIRQVYEKYPGILEGLKLSIRTSKVRGKGAGNFNPYERIVTLWKDSSGVDNPSTIRHELTHSLEQIMTPEARQAVVEAWARSFENAIKRNPDKKSQEFFNKVFDFLDRPSKETFDAATNVMPSYDFYQYMNPSEYWAVNAEKLMEAKLGTPWARFVSAVKKLFEALKSVFGVNNTFTVHKEFDNIINGKLERTKDEEMLVDYLLQGKVKLDFLNSIEDVNDLLDKHNRPDAPRKPSLSVRDAFMGGYDNTKETVKDVLTSPFVATNNMIGQADRALTYFRNKNIFFGYGLEEADRQRYGGQVRNAHQQAIASVAVVNALHSGNIATQVMTLGKLVFNNKIQMFVAEKSDKSMANVVREKAKLIDKLGFETGNRVIQSYFEAKRSRSIVNEYLNREAAYVTAIEEGQNEEEARKDLANIEAAVQKVNMNDEAMDDFIDLENKYPELRKMMDNWTAVNQNMIDMMEFSGIISKQRAKSLRSIKDYVPWYRIMDEQEDIHSAPKNTRGLTNVAADKKFGPGKTERDIDDIVDNMIHNVLTITRNSARNYAANRIVMEYGERYKEGKNAGKLRVFPKDGSDADGVRFNIIANGRRIVVRIQDPLVAEAVIGMENIDIPMNGALAFMANTLRRSITTFPAFQVAQLFMDAPTASLVTGLKRPDKVWLGVFTSFLKNLRKDDPIVAKLRAAGIGGYQSSARTPEKEIQLDIGLIQGSWFSKAMKGLDRFGDASDYAQRRSVYIQTMKETGDEMLALFQANNVIDFKKRGSGQLAQLVTRQVAFMNAYAQSIDVLAKGLSGTGLKGIDRKKAIARMVTAGMMLASATIVYCMLVGDDDEYNKLDDQTKMRTIFIPGLDIRLPMHSGAAFFFKAVPELIYNAIMKEGTKDEYDKKRLTRALGKAAVDSLIGPNVTPTGVKPFVEIALNRNFFTGGQVTPRGMEDLAAYRQYNQNTSELGKIISALTGTEKTRLLNPIEADHLVRGLTGTIGAAVMWGTNLLSGERPTPQAKDNPFYGQFIMPDVPRGREDLYYDLKSKTDEAYKTYTDLQKKQRKEEAAEWFKENKQLIQVYGYTSGIEADLKRLNGEIRRLSDLPSEKMGPDAKRKRMTELQELKGRILKDVISMRKRAGLDESYF
jgi:hypothetical protein